MKIIEKEILIEEVVFPNLSVIKNNDKVYKLKGAILGQKLMCSLGRKAFFSVLEKSYLETETPCPHFKECGGCVFQGLTYENQFMEKARQIDLLFSEFNLKVEHEKSPIPEFYRNKMEYSFGDLTKGGTLELGMHRRLRHHDVISVPQCRIAHPDFSTISSFVLNFVKQENYTKYSKISETGFLRHLVVRRTSLGELMIALSINPKAEEYIDFDKKKFIDSLKTIDGLVSTIKSILIVENTQKSDDVAGEVKVIYGRDYLLEELFGLRFKISLESFFQTNTEGAIILYKKAIQFLKLTQNSVLLDLFSGTGTIGQIASKLTGCKVIGAELIQRAVDDANESAKLNSTDCTYYCGDVFRVLSEKNLSADAIIVDPPRAGLGNKTTLKVKELGASEIVYISCNPVTLKEDLKSMLDSYQLVNLYSLDMFPFTSSVEMIAYLRKK